VPAIISELAISQKHVRLNRKFEYEEKLSCESMLMQQITFPFNWEKENIQYIEKIDCLL